MGGECVQQSVTSTNTSVSKKAAPPIHAQLHTCIPTYCSHTYTSQISDVCPITHAHALRGATSFCASDSHGAGPLPGAPSRTRHIVPGPAIREVGESTGGIREPNTANINGTGPYGRHTNSHYGAHGSQPRLCSPVVRLRA